MYQVTLNLLDDIMAPAIVMTIEAMFKEAGIKHTLHGCHMPDPVAPPTDLGKPAYFDLQGKIGELNDRLARLEKIIEPLVS